MKKLLKTYSFNSDMQYYEMIAESVINGQRKQAVEQFKAMPKEDKKSFLKSVIGGSWNMPLSKTDINMLIDAL